MNKLDRLYGMLSELRKQHIATIERLNASEKKRAENEIIVELAPPEYEFRNYYKMSKKKFSDVINVVAD